MDIPAMKEYILENNYAPVILEKLGCHHIRDKGDYISCGNPDGDNNSSVTLYLNTNLTVVNYTRTLNPTKKSHDIFDLVEFYLDISFFEAVKQICDWIDLDYYKDWNEDLPESLRVTKLLMELDNTKSIDIDDNTPLKPIPEHILNYYYPYVNDMFKKDNISYKTQKLFEIGYDSFTNRITIPIRDELSNLVGIKGRLFSNHLDEGEMKYLYIEPCNRSRILYGLDKALLYIKQKSCVYIVEAEKGVLQLWTMGIYNCVATGGKKISQAQIDMLSRLCVDIIFCFDKDVELSELEELADRFIESVNIYCLLDKNNILEEKESPTDKPDKFEHLRKNNIYKIK